jgi:hypothetical protein
VLYRELRQDVCIHDLSTVEFIPVIPGHGLPILPPRPGSDTVVASSTASNFRPKDSVKNNVLIIVMFSLLIMATSVLTRLLSTVITN